MEIMYHVCILGNVAANPQGLCILCCAPVLPAAPHVPLYRTGLVHTRLSTHFLVRTPSATALVHRYLCEDSLAGENTFCHSIGAQIPSATALLHRYMCRDSLAGENTLCHSISALDDVIQLLPFAQPQTNCSVPAGITCTSNGLVRGVQGNPVFNP